MRIRIQIILIKMLIIHLPLALNCFILFYALEMLASGFHKNYYDKFECIETAISVRQ